MLAGFTPAAIDDMDPDRRSRLLWSLHVQALEAWRTNPFLTKEGRAGIDLSMLPPDPRPRRH